MEELVSYHIEPEILSSN